VLYGFESPGLSTTPAADVISARTLTISFTLDHQDVSGNDIASTFVISATVRPPWHEGGGWGLKWLLSGSVQLEKEFKNGIKLSVETTPIPQENSNVVIKMQHGGTLDRWVLGNLEGTRLEIGTFTIGVQGGVAEEDLDFQISFGDCAFALHKGNSDSFITSLLPDKGISGIFDLGIGYSVKRKFYLAGGSGISVMIPLHAAISLYYIPYF
jgi:hypothetical protein